MVKVWEMTWGSTYKTWMAGKIALNKWKKKKSPGRPEAENGHTCVHQVAPQSKEQELPTV